MQALQMIIAGKEFVAKVLVDVGRGHGDVSSDEAVQLLSADLVHLKQMESFAKAFFACMAQEGAEITCVIFISSSTVADCGLESFKFQLAFSSKSIKKLLMLALPVRMKQRTALLRV